MKENKKINLENYVLDSHQRLFEQTENGLIFVNDYKTAQQYYKSIKMELPSIYELIKNNTVGYHYKNKGRL